MDFAVLLFLTIFGLIGLGTVAFVALSFHVGWTGYTPNDQSDGRGFLSKVKKSESSANNQEQ